MPPLPLKRPSRCRRSTCAASRPVFGNCSRRDSKAIRWSGSTEITCDLPFGGECRVRAPHVKRRLGLVVQLAQEPRTCLGIPAGRPLAGAAVRLSDWPLSLSLTGSGDVRSVRHFCACLSLSILTAISSGVRASSSGAEHQCHDGRGSWYLKPVSFGDVFGQMRHVVFGAIASRSHRQCKGVFHSAGHRRGDH
jgi:hypothetical protein